MLEVDPLPVCSQLLLPADRRCVATNPTAHIGRCTSGHCSLVHLVQSICLNDVLLPGLAILIDDDYEHTLILSRATINAQFFKDLL